MYEALFTMLQQKQHRHALKNLARLMCMNESELHLLKTGKKTVTKLVDGQQIDDTARRTADLEARVNKTLLDMREIEVSEYATVCNTLWKALMDVKNAAGKNEKIKKMISDVLIEITKTYSDENNQLPFLDSAKQE